MRFFSGLLCAAIGLVLLAPAPATAQDSPQEQLDVGDVLAELRKSAAAFDNFDMEYQTVFEENEPGKPPRRDEQSARVVVADGRSFTSWTNTSPELNTREPISSRWLTFSDGERYFWVPRGVNGSPDGNVVMWSPAPGERLADVADLANFRDSREPTDAIGLVLGATRRYTLADRYDKDRSDGLSDHWTATRDGNLIHIENTPPEGDLQLIGNWWINPAKGSLVERVESLHPKTKGVVKQYKSTLAQDPSGVWYPDTTERRIFEWTGSEQLKYVQSTRTKKFERPASKHPTLDWLETKPIDLLIEQHHVVGKGMYHWIKGEIVPDEEYERSLLPLKDAELQEQLFTDAALGAETPSTRRVVQKINDESNSSSGHVAILVWVGGLLLLVIGVVGGGWVVLRKGS